MPCDNQVGVKNVVLTFRDCDTDEEFGPIAHQLSSDTQPTYRLCGFTNEELPGGYISRTLASNTIDIAIIRNLGIPLALYQGCASVDIQVEHYNGLVYSGVGGSATGTDGSDAHEVTMTLIFKEPIDELLPDGTLDANQFAVAA
jgi:hypothetical protein